MTSWRDTTSQQAQDDLDDLLNAVLPFCEQTIGKHGQMWPHGAANTSDGSTAMVGIDTEHREGIALTLLIPYTRKRIRKSVEFGEMQVMTADREIWPGESNGGPSRSSPT